VYTSCATLARHRDEQQSCGPSVMLLFKRVLEIVVESVLLPDQLQ
jgi:hypothetical protein